MGSSKTVSPPTKDVFTAATVPHEPNENNNLKN